jgi:hypothetical protein
MLTADGDLSRRFFIIGLWANNKEGRRQPAAPDWAA